MNCEKDKNPLLPLKHLCIESRSPNHMRGFPDVKYFMQLMKEKKDANKDEEDANKEDTTIEEKKDVNK